MVVVVGGGGGGGGGGEGGAKPFSTFSQEIPCETTATQVTVSQTIDTYHCRNNWIFFTDQYFLLAMLAGFQPMWQRYLASQN